MSKQVATAYIRHIAMIVFPSRKHMSNDNIMSETAIRAYNPLMPCVFENESAIISGIVLVAPLSDSQHALSRWGCLERRLGSFSFHSWVCLPTQV